MLPITIPAATNTFLLVGVATSGGTISSITCADADLSQANYVLGVPNDPVKDTLTAVWQLVAPRAGAEMVVVTFSALGSTNHVGVMAFSNVNQSAPVAAKTGGSGAAPSSMLSLTTASDDLVASFTGQGTSIGGVGSGETEQFVDNVDAMHTLNNFAGATEAATAPSTEFTWFYGGSDDWQAIAVALQP
jgi:hypothetical protein